MTSTRWDATIPAGAGAVRSTRSATAPRRSARTASDADGRRSRSPRARDEAAALKIEVSAAQVRRRFDHIRGQQFPKPHEFEDFLRKSAQTVPDLLFRVEQSLLTTRLTRRALAGHRTRAAQEHALSGFVKAFKTRWRAQTYCAPEYTDSDCGHVQATL